MLDRSYIEFLRYARYASRRPDEAEDLLQTVLLAAMEAGRSDLHSQDNRRWVIGALRKRALFEARSAVRRRDRESASCVPPAVSAGAEVSPAHFVSLLPRNLRTTALLALTGHTKAEIIWLLRLSDAALRQRIAGIRARWIAAGGGAVGEMPGLAGTLEFGKIRQALLLPMRRREAFLASHDPDGHLFLVTSQKRGTRQQKDDSKLFEE